MDIYFEMLTYVLADKIRFEHTGSRRQEIKSIKEGITDRNLNSDTLYILNHENIENLERIKDLRKKGQHFRLNIIMEAENVKAKLISDIFCKEDNYAFMYPAKGKEDIFEMVQEAFLDLIKWDASFNENLLYEDDMRSFLKLGTKYLHEQFCIFDRDLNLIYNFNGQTFSDSEFEKLLSRSLFKELISDKDFHAVSKEKDVFYYENSMGEISLCFNLTVKGQYMARVILMVDEEQQRVPYGQEEIFAVFAKHINKALNYGKFVLNHRSNDMAHRILKSIASGGSVPEEAADITFKQYYKEGTDSFRIIVFRFFSAQDWYAQLELTLPYMAIQIEKEIENSMAAATEEEIIVLVWGKEENIQVQKEFRAHIATFVRENICKAGISVAFEKAADIKYGIVSAREALMIGETIKPHLWYFFFDDIRLDYVTGQLKKNLPADFIIHPALKTLKKYDEKNSSQLYITLRTYLKNNLSKTAAAGELFIHRTSLFHRLDHIKEITGLDLDDSETILSLLLSFKIDDVPC